MWWIGSLDLSCFPTMKWFLASIVVLFGLATHDDKVNVMHIRKLNGQAASTHWDDCKSVHTYTYDCKVVAPACLLVRRISRIVLLARYAIINVYFDFGCCQLSFHKVVWCGWCSRRTHTTLLLIGLLAMSWCLDEFFLAILSPNVPSQKTSKNILPTKRQLRRATKIILILDLPSLLMSNWDFVSFEPSLSIHQTDSVYF